MTLTIPVMVPEENYPGDQTSDGVGSLPSGAGRGLQETIPGPTPSRASLAVASSPQTYLELGQGEGPPTPALETGHLRRGGGEERTHPHSTGSDPADRAPALTSSWGGGGGTLLRVGPLHSVALFRLKVL